MTADPHHGFEPRKMPALLLNVAALAIVVAIRLSGDRLADILHQLEDPSFAAIVFALAYFFFGNGLFDFIVMITIGLNLALARIRHDVMPRAVSLRLPWFALFLNLGVGGYYVSELFSHHPARFALLQAVVLIVAAAAGIFTAAQFSHPKPPRKKWLRRLWLTTGTLGTLVVAFVVAAIVTSSDDMPECCKSKYAATASPADIKDLVLLHTSLNTLGDAVRGKLHGSTYAEEYQRLNFALPGEQGYEASGDAAVFPAVKDSVNENASKDNAYVAADILRRLTGAADTRILFNLRRHSTGDGPEIAIFAIVPGVKFCDGTTGFSVKEGFVISPDNHHVMDDINDFTWPKKSGGTVCVHTADGKNYYFQRVT